MTNSREGQREVVERGAFRWKRGQRDRGIQAEYCPLSSTNDKQRAIRSITVFLQLWKNLVLLNYLVKGSHFLPG